ERGQAFLRDRLETYQQEFGYKAIWSHEFSFPTWKENPAPILEAVRGYLETDYDYPAAIAAVKEDLEAAVRELMEGVPDGSGLRGGSAARPRMLWPSRTSRSGASRRSSTGSRRRRSTRFTASARPPASPRGSRVPLRRWTSSTRCARARSSSAR